MQDNTIQQWLLFKSVGIALMGISLSAIYFIIYLTKLFDIHSLLTLGNTIVYSGKVISGISSAPLFVYLFFFSARSVFRKETGPMKNSTLTGNLWGAFSVLFFIIGMISSLILPVGLKAMNYTSCYEDKIRAYYVIKPESCELIISKFRTPETKRIK